MGLTSYTHPSFWKCYYKLPKEIQKNANKQFRLFEKDPHHPSLGFGKKGDVWTVNIGYHYRAIGYKEGSAIIWFWVGSHEDYNVFMNRL